MADGPVLGNDKGETATGLPAVYAAAPASVSFKKLRKRILRQTQEAIRRYAMEQDGGPPQKWLVCLSGGKDSYTLLAALMDLKWQGALKAELIACNLDQGQPGFPKHILPDYLTRLGADYRRQNSGKQNLLFPVLAAQARHPLSRRAGGGLQRRRSRPSPRRRARNLHAQPVPWRAAVGDAAETVER